MSEPNDSEVSRRDLFTKVGLLLNGLALAILAAPVFGYLLSPVFRGRREQYKKWVTLGPVTEFPEGETRLTSFRSPISAPWDGDTDKTACWVRHIGRERFQVFAVNCAHLGCPVRWFPQSGLFMCPCHGGVYYQDGARASGPPPRGLFEYSYKIVNGTLLIEAGQLPTLSNTASLSERRAGCAG